MARTGSPRVAVARNTRTETSQRVSTARPSRRASHTAQAAAPCWRRGGATSSRGLATMVPRSVIAARSSRLSCVLPVLLDRDLVELVGTEGQVLAALEALHVG